MPNEFMLDSVFILLTSDLLINFILRIFILWCWLQRYLKLIIILKRCGEPAGMFYKQCRSLRVFCINDWVHFLLCLSCHKMRFNLYLFSFKQHSLMMHVRDMLELHEINKVLRSISKYFCNQMSHWSFLILSLYFPSPIINRLCNKASFRRW